MVPERKNSIYFAFAHDSPMGFLSNSYECAFELNGMTFQSVEQYLAKKKQETFEPTNESLASDILEATSPEQAIKLAQQVSPCDAETWNHTRLVALVDALAQKFSSPELKDKLLATGRKRIYYVMPDDSEWGIGLTTDEVERIFIRNPDFREQGDVDDATRTNKFGTNLLGNALVETRRRLQANN